MADKKKNLDCVGILGIPLWETDECRRDRLNQRKARQNQRQKHLNQRVKYRNDAQVGEALASGMDEQERMIALIAGLANTALPTVQAAAAGLSGSYGADAASAEPETTESGLEDWIVPVGLALAAAGVAYAVTR